MYSTLFKLSFRSLLKNKTSSIINVFGLSIGIALTLLILLFIIDEYNYDRFHENCENIYRLTSGSPADRSAYAGTPAPLAPFLKKEFPEIRSFVRIARSSWQPKVHINSGDNHFYESKFFLADSSFFNFFSFPLEKGDASTVLEKPNSVVITSSMALKYFGEDDPVGQELIFDNSFSFIVTGVAQDVPNNSHFKFDFIGRFEMINQLFHPRSMEAWGASNYVTYIMLEKGHKPSEIVGKINTHPFLYERITHRFSLDLQPLLSIRFEYNHLNQEPHIEERYLKTFIGIAIIVLLVACINYINLSTARSSSRALEVGVKKVMGANTHKLVVQFIFESIVLTFISFLISLFFIEIFSSLFNTLAGKDLPLNLLFEPKWLISFFVMIIVVGFIAGIYPAFFLSSVNTINVLKGNYYKGGKGVLIRNLLVLFQFTTATILIISSITINKQLKYVHEIDIGIDCDRIINVPLYAEDLQIRYREIKEELKKNPNIENVSANRFLPSRGTWSQTARWEGMPEEMQNTNMSVFAVDEAFFNTHRVNIVKGRDFIPESLFDRQNAYIVNQAAVDLMGMDDPIGRSFTVSQNPNGIIIGVIDNFNFKSLHSPIEPCAFAFWESRFDQLSIRSNTDRVTEIVKSISNKINKFSPNLPFEYEFAIDDFSKFYLKEIRIANLIGIFTFLSIIVASIGLFGLAIFLISQKTKEVGIRKTLGSSYPSIIILFIQNQLKWVVISNIIAWPVGYAIVYQWLNNFTYRIKIEFTTFLLASAITIAISFLTILFQTLKAANIKPIEALKYE